MADTNDQVLTQLNKVQGQIAGVIKMYNDDRTCIDVVRQVLAVRGALGAVARDLLTDEAVRCGKERKTDELNEVLKELFRN